MLEWNIDVRTYKTVRQRCNIGKSGKKFKPGGCNLGSLDHNEFAHKSTMEYFSQRKADVREHNVSNDRYS